MLLLALGLNSNFFSDELNGKRIACLSAVNANTGNALPLEATSLLLV